LAGTIAADGYAILAINPTAIMTVLGVEAIEIERIATNNSGERIAISSPTGALIDEVEYGDRDPWPDGADGDGATIELCDVTSDNSDPANWGVSLNDLGVTVGGIAFFGTPNAANSSTCEFVPDHTVEVSNNIFTPADLTINVGESVRWVNVQGFHNVNGSQATYPDNPVGFRNGDAASGAWMFDFTFDTEGVYDYQCDPHVGVGMVGTITVVGEMPPAIPTYDIGLVNTIDADGLPDSAGVECIVEGIVHGANLRGGGLQFALIDDSGDAMGLFSGTDLGYTYNEGDLIRVTGFIGHFNGLLQTSASAVELLGSPGVREPIVVNALGEETESQLIRINGLSLADPSAWVGDGSSFNIDLVDGSGNVIAMRVDSDTEVATWSGPGDGVFSVVGIGGQFDNSAPHDEGYQIFPRYPSDFDFLDSTDDELEAEVNIYPNPVANTLSITSDITPETYTIYNQWGEVVSEGVYAPKLDVTDLPSGGYVLVLRKEGKSKTMQFIK